jgi:hypothetical protein
MGYRSRPLTREDYNHNRPHSSLGSLTPVEFAQLKTKEPIPKRPFLNRGGDHVRRQQQVRCFELVALVVLQRAIRFDLTAQAAEHVQGVRNTHAGIEKVEWRTDAGGLPFGETESPLAAAGHARAHAWIVIAFLRQNIFGGDPQCILGRLEVRILAIASAISRLKRQLA